MPEAPPTTAGFAGSSLGACHRSVTAFGRAGKGGRPPAGSRGVKNSEPAVQIYIADVQLAPIAAGRATWPTGRDGGSGSGLATPLLLQKQILRGGKKKQGKKKKSKNVHGGGPGWPPAPPGWGPAPRRPGQQGMRAATRPPSARPSVSPSVRPSPRRTALLHASCYSACASQTRLPQSGSVILH